MSTNLDTTTPAATTTHGDILASLERVARSGWNSTSFWLVAAVVGSLLYEAHKGEMDAGTAGILATVLAAVKIAARAHVKTQAGEQILALADAMGGNLSTLTPQGERGGASRGAHGLSDDHAESAAGRSQAGSGAPPFSPAGLPGVIQMPGARPEGDSVS